MPAQKPAPRSKRTIADIRQSKLNGEKLVCTSVPDYTSAKWAELAGTDGQILLCHDLLGVFTDFKPRFTKRYATLSEAAVGGLRAYVREVKSGAFPDAAHSYSADDAEVERFRGMLEHRIQH